MIPVGYQWFRVTYTNQAGELEVFQRPYYCDGDVSSMNDVRQQIEAHIKNIGGTITGTITYKPYDGGY